MADRSGIEWTEATWNPTTGCDRVSPGCDRCYAQTLARRLKAVGSPKYQNDGDPSTSGPGFKLALHPSSLDVPQRRSAPRLVFVDSMSDLFHDDVPPEFIAQVFEVIRETPQHTCQVLTKRAQRLSRIAGELDWPSNLPMGASVETRRYAFRIDHLRKVPAAVRSWAAGRPRPAGGSSRARCGTSCPRRRQPSPAAAPRRLLPRGHLGGERWQSCVLTARPSWRQVVGAFLFPFDV